ncbi:hypothetical protein P3L10_001162 [Capsicum annuum]
MRRIIVAAKKSPLELTWEALSQLESTERDLLLKWVENRHQVSYICMFTHMFKMKNLSLMNIPESPMKDLKKYYEKKYYKNLLLIKLKHITKLPKEKRSEEYLVLDLKQKATTASHKSVPAADYDLDEFVKRLISALKNQLIPIVFEEVQKLVSSRSVVTPPATTLDDFDSLDDDCNDLDQL